MRARLRPHNGRQVIMGVRPEHLALGDGAPGSAFDARVEVVEQLGSEILLETRVGGNSVTVARVPAETQNRAGRSGPPLGAARPAAFLRFHDRTADLRLKPAARGLFVAAVPLPAMTRSLTPPCHTAC